MCHHPLPGKTQYDHFCWVIHDDFPSEHKQMQNWTLSAHVKLIFYISCWPRWAAGINSGASLGFITVIQLILSLLFQMSWESFSPFLCSLPWKQKMLSAHDALNTELFPRALLRSCSVFTGWTTHFCCSQANKRMSFHLMQLVHSIVLELKIVLLIKMDSWKNKTWGETAQGLFKCFPR